MDVLATANARAAAGADVLHLEVGEPGNGAPPAAIAAATAALAQESCGYTEAFGLDALRRRLAEHYRDSYGLSVDPGQIAATMGASGAFILAFLAAFDAGARVIVTEPGYPAYRNILAALDIEVVALPTTLATRFQPTVSLLEAIEGPIDGLVLASPANPTGSMLPRAELERIARWCGERGARIVSDEIYHGITYGEPAESVLAFSRDAIVINSFSKFFCMTGWRLGWLVLPQGLVEPARRLAQNLFIAPPTIAQHAALGAFADLPLLKARIEAYGRNRARLLEALAATGLTQIAPVDGAFYLYIDVSPITDDSVALSRRLLAEADIAVTPGVDFDPTRGKAFIRLSFAGAEVDVERAAERLSAWLQDQSPR
jgi:aspartate/methionine/tyrosine aminotransferase